MVVQRWVVRGLCLGVLALGLATPTVALESDKDLDQYNIRRWTLEDGLPSDTVTSLAQTPDGYLWIGTNAGLVRTDGRQFMVFDVGNVEAMESSVVNTLAVDSAGVLWVGTNAGLLRLDAGRFERVDRRLELGAARILRLETFDGGLLIGTYGAGLVHLQNDGTVRRFSEYSGALDQSIWALTVDTDGQIWFAPYVGGVYRIEDSALHHIPLPEGREQGVGNLFPRVEGGVWMATNNGLLWSDAQGQAHVQDAQGPDAPTRPVRRLLVDRHGSLWLGTEGQGVFRVDTSEVPWRFEHLSRDPWQSLVIDALFEDREGHVWVGTRNLGLLQLMDGPFTTVQIDEGPGHEIAASVYIDAAGDRWTATLNGGLRVVRRDGRVETFGVDDGLPLERLWAVTGDGAGGLWIGTSGGGLAHRDVAGRFRTFGPGDGLDARVIFGLYRDDETLWMTSNVGLLSLRDGRFETLTVADGLGTDRTRAVLRDRAGDLWVGTSGGGLHRQRDGGFERWTVADGLPSDVVWSLHEDGRGQLWIGTDGGVARMVDQRPVPLRTRDGVGIESVGAMASTDEDLWLATARGVLQLPLADLDLHFIDPSTPVVGHRFGRAEGLLDERLWPGIQPAVAKDEAGRLWWPMAQGLAWIDPTTVDRQATGPPAQVEGWLVDGAASDVQVLPAGTLRLEIDYTALGFRAPHRIRFRYRLVGFDPEWVEAGWRRRATYTHLPPGRYAFEVTARNENGAWHPEPATFRFEVEPFPWERDGFYVGVLGLLAALGWGIYRLRVAALVRRERELQRRVDAALAQVETLSPLVPICSECRKVRDDRGFWSQLEVYIAEHFDAKLSHGLCPSCADQFMEAAGLPPLSDRESSD